VYLYLALAYAHLGNNTHAEKHFAQAIALSPHDGYVFYNWGAYLHRQNRLAEALKAYETAYRLDPALIGAMQAANALRGRAPDYIPVAPQSPHAPTPTATPPPVQPTDLYTPAASRHHNDRGCITNCLIGLAFVAIVWLIAFAFAAIAFRFAFRSLGLL
jgi:tetratricopeptide (TPR) repeat protein